MQNDFFRDDAWQRQVRDAILVPQFYGSARFNGRYVLMDKGRCTSVIQRRLAVDTIVQSKAGGAVCIEEKIVRWPGYRYDSICLETDSCTKPGLESEGWMRYGAADYLLYCFAQKNGDLDCWLIDFPALKSWFWPRYESFPQFGPLPTANATRGRKVPLLAVRASVAHWQLYFRAFPAADSWEQIE